jgi:hypothetical protein
MARREPLIERAQEDIVTTECRMTLNRRIEADRRQRRFATLAPSAHAGR